MLSNDDICDPTFSRYTYVIEFICYDDACHPKRFARNPVRKDLTIQTKQLASVEMSVDKMHMKGHTDPWCKANCDPMNFTKLNKVLQSSKSQVLAVNIILLFDKYFRLTLKCASKYFLGYQDTLVLHKK